MRDKLFSLHRLSSCTRLISTSTLALIGLRVLGMFLPVLYVESSQFLVMEDKEVLGVLLFDGLGKIETPGNYRLTVQDHDLVVSDRVGRVYFNRNALVGEEHSGRISSLLPGLALVQDDIHLHASFMGIEQSFSDVR